MAIEIRRGKDRGYAEYSWLKTYHSFSFSTYYDAKHVQFGPLRVLNEDFVSPGAGFDTHSHQDMEVVSYVLAGTLSHKDSTGGVAMLRSGEVQRMTAGTGIAHSEFNDGDEETTHFLQIWIIPDKKSLNPGYEQKQINGLADNCLVPVVSNTPSADTLFIHQDVTLYVCGLRAGNTVHAAVETNRLGYLHNTMVGGLKVNGDILEPGDALKITGYESLECTAVTDSRFILIDMKR
ncbi:MAG: pirin family protein [Nitrospirae bacterium]|nr:pirin family protein [Nitrospirota bacterium]